MDSCVNCRSTIQNTTAVLQASRMEFFAKAKARYDHERAIEQALLGAAAASMGHQQPPPGASTTRLSAEEAARKEQEELEGASVASTVD